MRPRPSRESADPPRATPDRRRLRLGVRLAAVLTLAAASTVAWLLPMAASAHSLDSSTVWVQVTGTSVHITLSVPVETLDTALGTDADSQETSEYEAEVVDYIDEHLAVTGDDGAEWAETYSSVTRETIEGIDSLTIEIDVEPGTASTDEFTLAYDAIVESVDGHEAVVVVTSADGDVSTPGIVDGAGGRVEIGGRDGATVAVGDMVHHGFQHVLQGADHLLFLLTLLLPAPMLLVGSRWRPGGRAWPSLRNVAHVVTAFTIGHSVTLVASALGWVSLPSRPVEVIIAASVAVSAIHAIRPLAGRGETAIALVFGLVHGLAFAGILADLGLAGSTSVLALLSFNLGIEAAQLVTIAVVFPSVYVIARTRFATAFRVAAASVALGAAIGWMLDRLGVLANPVAPLEEAAVGHPWYVVVGLALIAQASHFVERLWPGVVPRRHGAHRRDAAHDAWGEVDEGWVGGRHR